MDIATDATENVDEYLDGTKSELNHKSQKRKSRRKRISTKKTKINYDVFKNWDDDEDQSTDNSLNHNPEPGCSTESNKEDNEETILTKFNDNIMDIATDATENVDEHLEDFEIIEKGLDNICIDSNKIIEPIPSCSGTNMQRKYSYRERSDSETNDIRNVNMTNNTEENIFDDSSDENLKSLPSITLNQCFHPFNEECIQDDENREPSPSTKTIYSEIEQLHNACHESELILNNNNCRFRRPNDEEESREAFLYKLMNDSKPVEHFYLDDNIYPTEKEICDNEKRLNQLLTSNLLPENKSEIVFGENLNEEIKEIMKSKKLSDIRLTLRGYKFDHGLPMYVYSEFKSDDLPSDIEQECEQIPKDPQVFSEEQMPELNNVNVPAAGVLQPIECANVPNETNTEPMNDDKEDEGTD
ncbi:Hypothetical protein CINCED_3A024092 [Cinara cedri]|uniref:Uncharacterized protein n=1 Tax=Cinara cedri TaxID=506608 RepID=A0A5E4NDC6_9HEMI|nr:Hypothetical protein CINCED_3A024092 [Cinara cedri]